MTSVFQQVSAASVQEVLNERPGSGSTSDGCSKGVFRSHVYDEARERNELKARNPEECEVVGRDPLVGEFAEFAIDEEFANDVKEYSGTEPIWSQVSRKHLKSTFLESSSNDLPTISGIVESERHRQVNAADVPNMTSNPRLSCRLRSKCAAGIPSIVMNLTSHRIHNSEGGSRRSLPAQRRARAGQARIPDSVCQTAYGHEIASVFVRSGRGQDDGEVWPLTPYLVRHAP
jgi:hypothetical protein